jgi:hypothetical protein
VLSKLSKVVNVTYKLQDEHFKKTKISMIEMLRKEKK